MVSQLYARCASQQRSFFVLAWCLGAATCLLPLPASAQAARQLTAATQADSPYAPILPRRELGMVPIIGGDSDIGVATGFIGSYAQFDASAQPYRLRVEVSALVSSKHGPSGFTNPYQDVYAAVSLPSLWHNRLHLSLRGAYTAYHHLLYYGIGNASRAGAAMAPAAPQAQYNQYQLRYPHGTATLGLQLVPHLTLSLGVSYARHALTVLPGSKLAEDIHTGEALMRGDGIAALWKLEASLQWDSRDDEIVPQRGKHHTLSVRASPGHFFDSPYAFAGINFSWRQFVPLWRNHLVLAARLVADILVGEPPFFALAESADGYALGGGNGVRGLPAQRYYGKTKTYGNLELRARVLTRQALDQRLRLALVAFADGGRLWATVPGAHPELDGTGAGIKYGLGGGVRLQWGETFLLRGDVAWSPDAHPVACYFNVGHAF
jgi:outer membrane protein assembly factor BamA